MSIYKKASFSSVAQEAIYAPILGYGDEAE